MYETNGLITTVVLELILLAGKLQLEKKVFPTPVAITATMGLWCFMFDGLLFPKLWCFMMASNTGSCNPRNRASLLNICSNSQ